MESNKLTGSRDSDDDVPNANWYDGKFQVNWYNPQNANPNLRARAEIPALKGV